MAESFTFGFSGDDIEADADDTQDGMDIDVPNRTQLHDQGHRKSMTLFPAQKHSLEDVLRSLPSSISYNTVQIPLLPPPPDQPNYAPAPPPSATQNQIQQDHQPSSIRIRRRSLFDILLQLKAESDVPVRSPHARLNVHLGEQTTPCQTLGHSPADLTSISDNADLISSIEGTTEAGTATDLQPGIYEGGFKTWECALDLAAYVASFPTQDRSAGGISSLWGEHSRGEGGAGEGGFDVVELGAGSAIPSLVLLRFVLDHRQREGQRQHAQDGASTAPHATREAVRFILCDYNAQVLNLVSGANVLLQLCGAHYQHSHGDEGAEEEEVDKERQAEADLEGELEHITPLLTEAILQNTQQAGVFMDFISGTWGAGLVDLICPQPDPMLNTKLRRPMLILASETIYSRASTIAFTETVLGLLDRAAGGSVALIAAKKVYLGVGGSVDEFVRRLEWRSREGGKAVRGGRGVKVDVVRDIRDDHGGVGRVILRVRWGEQ